MSQRVIHFEIQADDPARAKAFYESTFGWKIDKWKGQSGGMDYWMIVTGKDGEPGINGGMYKRPQDKPSHMYDCTVSVDNLDTAIEDVQKNGGVITQGKMEIPGVGWFARGTDPEGNIFGLMQPTAWQPH